MTNKNANIQPVGQILLLLLFVFSGSILADDTEHSLSCLKEQSVVIDSMPHPIWDKHFVYLFHPQSPDGNFPVIFFCHGIGADNPSRYDGLISQFVKSGCAVIYSPYKSSLTKTDKCYRMMWGGFEGSVKRWKAKLDVKRVGFFGHSYGGGAVPALANKAFKENNWGSQASFMYIMAPWFSHWITQTDLDSFLPETRLVMQVFEDDFINDPRMALDIYHSINIKNKQFLYTYNDTSDIGVLHAGHDLPEGKCASHSSFDTLRLFGISQTVEFLTQQINTGYLSDSGKTFSERLTTAIHHADSVYSIDTTDHFPQTGNLFIKPEICYVNFWHHAMNPRAGESAARRIYNPKTRISSKTTMSNYFMHFLYPVMLEGQEEDLADDHFSQWEEDIECRDTTVFKQMVQNRKDECQQNSNTMPSGQVVPGIVSSFLTQMVRNRSIECKYSPGPIDSGFGSRGKFNVIQRFIPNSGKGSGRLRIFIPQGGRGPFPVIFFTPTLKISSKKYRELLFLIASRGYIVIASINNQFFSNDKKRLEDIQSQFEMCEFMVTGMVDTARVGFIAHSRGTAPLLSVASNYIGKRMWGTNGIFIFLMAPSFNRNNNSITLEGIPKHTLIGMQLFKEHTAGDRKKTEDIYNQCKINDLSTHLMLVNSYEKDWFEIESHRLSPLCEDRDDDLNCIDDYGIFRPISIMAHYAFNSKQIKNYKEQSKEEIFKYQVDFNGTKWVPITSLTLKPYNDSP